MWPSPRPEQCWEGRERAGKHGAGTWVSGQTAILWYRCGSKMAACLAVVNSTIPMSGHRTFFRKRVNNQTASSRGRFTCGILNGIVKEGNFVEGTGEWCRLDEADGFYSGHSSLSPILGCKL